jgi:ribosome-binding ATPase YchF (GTP1/OBG family)
VGDKDAKKAFEILSIYKNHLESFKNASTVPVDEHDKKYVDDLFLLTTKPVIYVCNVDEQSAVNGNQYSERVKEFLKDEKTEILIIAERLKLKFQNLKTRMTGKFFWQM